MDSTTPGFPVLHHLPEPAQTDVHWVSDAIWPSHPLPPSSPPALNLSQHQGFSSESTLCIRWPKNWSLSFSISPSHEYSGLISLWVGWFNLLSVSSLLIIIRGHSASLHSPLVEAAVTDATQIQGERVKTPPVIEEGRSFVGAHGARNIIAICRKSFTNITDLKRWMNKWMLLSSDSLKSAEVGRLKQRFQESGGREACGLDFDRDVEDSRIL